MIRYLFLLFCLINFFATTSKADIIQMNPTVTITVDSASKMVAIELTVKNEGDEVAKEVSLDLPELGESHQLTAELAPQAETSKKLEFTFKRMRIDAEGGYQFPYRLFYKDVNLYPLSAAYTAEYVNGIKSSQVLVMKSKEGTNINLAHSRQIPFTIRNVGTEAFSLRSLRFLGPAEIEISNVNSVPLPYTIEPNSGVEFSGDLLATGALYKSTYAVSVIASGEYQGKQVTEVMHLMVSITKTYWEKPQIVYLVLGLAALGVLYGAYRRRKA